MKVIKGDINNLEGRAIIYCKQEDRGDSIIEARFLTTSIWEFSSFHNGDEYKKKQMFEKMLEIYPDSQIMLRLSTCFGSKKDLSRDIKYLEETGKLDVWDSGVYPLGSLCKQALNEDYSKYLTLFIRQQDRLLRQPSGFENLPNFPKNLSIKYYVSRLVRANFNKKEKEFEAISKDFVKFSKGKWIKKDAADIVEVIKNRELPHADELFNLYLKKIDAVQSEDYKKASELNQQINMFKGTNNLKE